MMKPERSLAPMLSTPCALEEATRSDPQIRHKKHAPTLAPSAEATSGPTVANVREPDATSKISFLTKSCAGGTMEGTVEKASCFWTDNGCRRCGLSQVVQRRLHPAQRRDDLPMGGKTPANVTLPSGKAELNNAMTGVSEGIRIKNALREVFSQDSRGGPVFGCKCAQGHVALQGCKVTQGALRSEGAKVRKVRKVSRAENAPDVLTCPVSKRELAGGLRRMEHHTTEEFVVHP